MNGSRRTSAVRKSSADPDCTVNQPVPHGPRHRGLNRLALVLLTHPAGHHALQTHSDLLADTALRRRGAELAGETEVVPFGPGLDYLAVLPPIDAYTSHRRTGPGRREACELATVRSLAVPPQHDLVVGGDYVVDDDPRRGTPRGTCSPCP